jgi:hypothetical protein
MKIGITSLLSADLATDVELLRCSENNFTNADPILHCSLRMRVSTSKSYYTLSIEIGKRFVVETTNPPYTPCD